MTAPILVIGATGRQRSAPMIASDPQALTVTLDRPPLRLADFVRENLSRFATTTTT